MAKKINKDIKDSKVKIIALIVVLIILVLLINTLLNKKSNPLVGKWDMGTGTIYQFDKDYTGKLIVSSIGEYKYKYEFRDNDIVFVDFESDTSTDTEFSYKVEDDKLTLKSSNGTFTFKKID